MAVLRRYRVLRGIHQDENKVFHDAKDRKTAIFETKVNLDRWPEKFLNVGNLNTEDRAIAEDIPHATIPEVDESEMDSGDSMDIMTVAQLKEFAAQEKIDLSGAEKKSEILARIREVMESR